MHFFYTIIFALMMLIDWTKGSQAGSVWAVTVNCVGILLGIILFTILPKMQKSTKRQHVILWTFCIVVSGICFIPWHQGRGYLIWLHYLTVVLNIAILGSLFIEVCMLRLWKRVKELSKYQKSMALLWVIMMLYMCISPLKSVWPIWFLCLFGIYYIVPISEERKRQLLQGVLNGVVVGFFAIQIWAYGFRPYDVVRYTGAYMNANANALMYLITYAVLLVKVYQLLYQRTRYRVHWLVFYTVLLAGMWGFMFMTGCRTAIYISILMTFVFGVLVFIRNFNNGVSYWNNICRVGGCGVVLPIVVSVVFVACYATVRYLPCILHHPVWLEMEYAEWKVHSFDPWDSDKYVSFEELLTEINGRVKNIFAAREAEHAVLLVSENVVSDSMYGKEAYFGNSMNVRKQIYIEYLKRLNWRGHELEEGYIDITSAYHAYHAQNLWIQMAFYYGIPAGVLLLVLTACTGIRSLIGVLTHIPDEWYLFTALVWVGFFGFGAMECVWYPGQMILFLIFFTQKDLGKG